MKPLLNATEAKKIFNFKTLGVEEIPTLLQFFREYPSRSCDFSIGGSLMWSEFFSYRYDIVDNTLFLVGKEPEADTTLFYQPCGELSEDAALALIKQYVYASNIQASIIKPIEVIPNILNTDTSSGLYIDDWKEYLYDIKKFRGFPGRKMEKKRNHLHSFLNSYPQYSVAEISAENIADLIRFTRNHSLLHDDYLFHYENNATIAVLEHYDSYPFTGIVIMVDNKIAGYTFGEIIGDTLHVHVEKGDVNYRGIYQALASTFCESECGKHTELRYVNREEDMGHDDLRQSKSSYHPDLFICKQITPIS